jgi:hypothetical protein
MKEMLRTTAFRAGLLGGICAFGLINGLAYRANHYDVQILHNFDRTIIFNHHSVVWDMDAYGIPFTYYYSEKVPGSPGLPFGWVEALADVLTALTCSVLLGLVFNLVYSKFKHHPPPQLPDIA